MELILRIAALLAGLGLLWTVIRAAVGTMLIPRPTRQRVSRWVGRLVHTLFHLFARRARSYAQLDHLLAAQGPSAVLAFLAVFLLAFLGAFALIFYGLGGTPIVQAFYLAGSGLSTLGTFNASGLGPVAVLIASAFMGSTVVAVFIGFLLTLYAAYTARETALAGMALIIGEPAWGPELLVRLRRLNNPLENADTTAWIDWICSLRINHVYPVLNHFRSPFPNRHWVVSLLALCDAAAIRLAAVPGERDLALIRLLAEGANAFDLLRESEIARTHVYAGPPPPSPWLIERAILEPSQADTAPVPDPGLSREEWDRAMSFLEENQIALNPDRDASWRAFCRLRSIYAEPAYFLASALCAIPAPWSGPRHGRTASKFPTHWPQLAREHWEERHGVARPSSP